MENKIVIDGIFTKQINFAMQQNYVPVIRNLVVTNKTEEILKQLQLNISFAPEFADTYQYIISEIKPAETIEIPRIKIQMKTEYLFSLTEKMVGSFKIFVSRGDEVLGSMDNGIELLACDQWTGVSIMPEIISAFVMPNHPLITKVITNASQYLSKWTGSPSFTGYQTRNPENVKHQMAAIYSALKAESIIYNNPPVSYENSGQRIRLPHMVLEQKMGTCLDLAVLYATCLEAVGLHPLLCFIKGHAFGGSWLEEETFADCVVDEISAISNRLIAGAKELLLVECTDFVSGKDMEFDRAIKHGEDHMVGDDFHCVIDVKRSRGSGIRPMPTQLESVYQSGISEENDKETEKTYEEQAPKSLENIFSQVVLTEDRPLTKQKVWERKLLDFSLRNTLLNFRVTKNAFQILVADLGELEDRLSDGKEFRIMEAPSEFVTSLRDMKMYEIDTEKDLIQSIAQEEFKSSRIRTFLDEGNLEKNLKSLYRNARMSMEENGTNTLFLALGFLKWYESDVSEKARMAPIVLIPVDIVRNRKNKGYIIRSRQEEAQMNITLLEYLKQDHNVNIGGLDPLPEDQHGIDIQLIFHILRQGIMGKKRWMIENMAFVGLFSFGQFVMWNDIHNRSQELEQNKIVASLISGNRTWIPVNTALKENEDIEDVLHNMAVPVSADSSQMVAISAAANGQSFVLHGPPGTGKSQTITNMIANTLYQGKTVLFVAEKMAALNVVQKRLADIGLEPFCLELHSNKTNKSTVLSSLNRSLEVGKIKSPEEYQEVAEKLQMLRGRLNDVMKALHDKRACGSSLYEAIEYFEQNSNQKGKVSFSRDVVVDLDKQKITQFKEWIREYVIIAKEIGIYADHPLVRYKGCSYSLEKRQELLDDLENVINQYEDVKQCMKGVCDWIGEEIKSREEAEDFLNVIEAGLLPGITLKDIITSQNYDGIEKQVQQLIVCGTSYQEQAQELTEKFEDSILEYDVSAKKMEWKQAEESWVLSKFIKQGKLVKELNLHAKQKGIITKNNIVSVYDELQALQQNKKQILEAPNNLIEQMSGMFFGLQTNWEDLKTAIEKARCLYQSCEKIHSQKRQEVLSNIPQLEDFNKESLLSIRQYISMVEDIQRKYILDLELQE